MRLEIAVGDRPTLTGDDVIYCDLRDCGIRPLVVCDINETMPFASGRFQVVAAMHCLEHISHVKTDQVLREWIRLLASGGQMRIDVPNLRYWASRIVGNPNDHEAVIHLYGNQDYGDLNVHRTGFTPVLLEKALRRAGLTFVSVQDVGAALVAEGFKA